MLQRKAYWIITSRKIYNANSSHVQKIKEKQQECKICTRMHNCKQVLQRSTNMFLKESGVELCTTS